MRRRSLSRAYVFLFVAAGYAFSCALNPQPIPPSDNPTSSAGASPPAIGRDASLGSVSAADAAAPHVDATTADAGASGLPQTDDASDGSPAASEDAGDASDALLSPASEDAGDASDAQVSEADDAEDGDP
ncbi:MAG TPA: hypothetical protein VK841_02165 [Polyangiaceae bacterium]|jgi:hypothetical protein|nr:hypothetical protein [Polyangiaceae bacterium]